MKAGKQVSHFRKRQWFYASNLHKWTQFVTTEVIKRLQVLYSYTELTSICVHVCYSYKEIASCVHANTCAKKKMFEPKKHHLSILAC